MSEFFEEGSAKIHKEENTFFNPAQQLNRDLSAITVREFFKDRDSINIFTAMSATGLRGIRYLNEIPNSRLFFNDISPEAVETIKHNLELNGFTDYHVPCPEEDIRKATNRINVTLSDCSILMNRYPSCFDVIDIDPFGSCANFVSDALKAIKHNGLLCFTCTDKAALCSKENRCYIRYGSRIKRLFSKNETPVRVLLSYISREAAKLEASIRPIISLSVDFYVRVIVQVKKRNEKNVLSDNIYALLCDCLYSRMQGLSDPVDSMCVHCNKNMKLYGPFWSKALYDYAFINSLLEVTPVAKNERVVGILRLMAQELSTPFYYQMTELSSKFKENACKIKYLMNALAHACYNVSVVYYDNNAIKTDAPIDVVRKVMIARNGDDSSRFNFEEHPTVRDIFKTEFFKGKIMSGMKPGSLPKTK